MNVKSALLQLSTVHDHKECVKSHANDIQDIAFDQIILVGVESQWDS